MGIVFSSRRAVDLSYSSQKKGVSKPTITRWISMSLIDHHPSKKTLVLKEIWVEMLTELASSLVLLSYRTSWLTRSLTISEAWGRISVQALAGKSTKLILPQEENCAASFQKKKKKKKKKINKKFSVLFLKYFQKN